MFESSERKGDNHLGLGEESSTSNPWVDEAAGWIETYEKVCGYSIDSDLPAQVESQMTFQRGVFRVFQRHFKTTRLKLWNCIFVIVREIGNKFFCIYFVL